MRIVILSDIHDNVWKLAAVLNSAQTADALICCGDLCSPFIIDRLAEGFPGPIYVVFGNNDADLFRITTNAKRYDHVHLAGEFLERDLGGKRFAVHHFNNVALALAGSGRYDVVCFGHNHVFQVEMRVSTLLINPGSIMGYHPGNKARNVPPKNLPSTFVVYDTESGAAEGFQVTADNQGVLIYP
ncbi:MAG: metallophosphoesterase family protein [Chloroflexota bacterium]